jgi:hypothetical protein
MTGGTSWTERKMKEPADLARRAEEHPQLPPGSCERVAGRVFITPPTDEPEPRAKLAAELAMTPPVMQR